MQDGLAEAIVYNMYDPNSGDLFTDKEVEEAISIGRKTMAEYIERERIEKFFDGIYDCADLVFEPNDHCCAPDDCAHCKWYEAKNAIQKRILSIPAADVRPVRRGKWVHEGSDVWRCSECDYGIMPWNAGVNFCPNCGAVMEEI